MEIRLAILQAKAKETRLKLPQEGLYFITKQVQTNIRELEGALNRITAFAHLVNSPSPPIWPLRPCSTSAPARRSAPLPQRR
ncbi:MAG: hypothetical protein DRI26_07305 [Chloroflexi bacterium]|nr:MAG: hypothetical protein DRI26_07305 [Chloroflexota bacterium]